VRYTPRGYFTNTHPILDAHTSENTWALLNHMVASDSTLAGGGSESQELRAQQHKSHASTGRTDIDPSDDMAGIARNSEEHITTSVLGVNNAAFRGSLVTPEGAAEEGSDDGAEAATSSDEVKESKSLTSPVGHEHKRVAPADDRWAPKLQLDSMSGGPVSKLISSSNRGGGAQAAPNLDSDEALTRRTTAQE